MIFVLAIGGAVAGLAALVALRGPATAPAATGTAAPPPAPPVVMGPPVAGNGTGTPGTKSGTAAADAAGGKSAKGLDLGTSAGILGAAGVLGGLIAGQSALTQDAKDAALPVGIGVAAATFLATNVGGVAVSVGGAALAGVGAAAALVLPVILLTVAVVTIIDVIDRAIKVGDWVQLVKQIVQLRSTGQFQEALALWEKSSPKIDAIERVWPRPDEDWFNAADPMRLGTPYPGFPNAPAPATAAEAARWPSMVPSVVTTKDGREVQVRQLFDALNKDIRDIRAWGLANKVPGRVLVAGKEVTTDTGDRDLRGWKPYDTARNNLSAWGRAIAVNTPWLSPAALEQPEGLTPVEKQVSAPKQLAQQQASQLAARSGAAAHMAGANVPGAHGPNAGITTTTGNTRGMTQAQRDLAL